MTSEKVNAIFVYYGEDRQKDFDEHLAGKAQLHLAIVKNKDDEDEERLDLEDIFLSDIRWSILNYNNQTGILKLGISPSVPLWVFDKFNSWFIPVFDKFVEN